MSAYVLDASVALTWLFGDGADPVAESALDRLSGDTALVPPVWGLEVANGLVVAERAGKNTEARSIRFMELLAALPIERGPDAEPIDLAALGRRAGTSVYDASYLDLALRQGLPLATLDKRLAKAAQALGIALL